MKNLNLKLGICLLILTGTLANGATKNSTETVQLSVTEKGFEPNQIKVKAGTDLVLSVTRKTDQTCSNDIVIPSKNLKVALPLNKTVIVKVGKVTKGELHFSCKMGMDKGVVTID
jgi:plastocyanin domain-containing protein